MTAFRTAIAALLLLAPTAFGQEKELPKGETILDDYVKATGGLEAYKKITSRVAHGTMEIVGAGLTGKITITQKAPNLMMTEIEFEGIGKIIQATDGKVAWSIDPNTGERVLEGEEKSDFMREAILLGEADWRKQYEKAECVAKEDVDGNECYKVVLTPKSGTPSTAFYDVKTGLMRQQQMTAKTPQGPIDVVVTVGEYKDLDGIKMPFDSTQQVLTQSLKTSFDDVKHNVEIPADKFAIPDSIKKLIVN